MKFLNFILLISVFWAIPLYAYDWPIKEDTVQHVLTSVMGECRQDRDHFHRGIDINAPCSTSVYTIEGDTCYKDLVATPRGINIGHFRYYHMVIADTIQDTTWLAADSFFAKTDGENHIHLQEADTILKSPGDLNNVNWLNLLRNGGIYPYEDSAATAYPVIRDGTAGIKFWRQGTNDTISRDTVMDGRIDISVDARDPWTDSLGGGVGGGATGNMGVYKNYGYVFAESDTSRLDTLIEFEHHKYDICPSDQNITYAYAPGSGTSRHIYSITNNPYDTLNPQNYYWNTKQQAGQPDSVDADSIEVAKFKDGYYWVIVKAYDIKNNADSESVYVHVDNFKPKIKEKRPTDWFAFVPTKEKRVWCTFSEPMDTATLNETNIKIQSLKIDSLNYDITNITYTQDDTLRLYKLTLEVDSFRFKDTVQVRLLDGVKDLAGKSIDTTGSEQTIAYSWTFVVGVMQLTNNDLNDVYPDVYDGKIVWMQAPVNDSLGEIMLYNYYKNTTTQISPGYGIHNAPYIYEDEVTWLGYGFNVTNYVFYYDGSTTTDIAQPNRGRYSLAIDDGGVVWRAYLYAGGEEDTIWIEYYNPDSDEVYVLDQFLDSEGRLEGSVDIDGNEIVWDHDMYPQFEREIYYYCNGDTQNFSSDTSQYDGTPDISYGQIAWLKQNGINEAWFYDGANKRKIAGIDDWNPQLHNGSIAWIKESGMYSPWHLKLYDGRDTLELMTKNGMGYWPFLSVNIHNNQVVWLRLTGTSYYATYYDGNETMYLTVEPDSLNPGDSYRIEAHDGFVVYDAWDGNDYEIYLYIGDTLFTPPAIVRNLRNEIIEADANNNQVKLTWSPNSESDLAGYKIYRSDTSYQYDTIPYDSVLATDTIFIDTIPLDGYNYYVVTAYDNVNNEGGFSNQTTAFIDVFPPSAPYVNPAEKSSNDVVLTWNKITTDTLGNSELMHYYVVYRNTSPSFIPGSSDSIGYVSHPDTVFTDTGVLDSTDSYYYLVKAVDWARNQSKKSNMGYKLNKEVIENASATDKNWVSLPYHSEYSTVSDLSTDLSPAGDPLVKVTNLRDDQLYENYTYTLIPFPHWSGVNFAITPGRAYEMVTINDTSLALVGSNNPDGLVSLNENAGATSDRNWVSIPYNADYTTVEDITTEYSSAGDPLVGITNLRDDQLYESWIYDSFFGWFGTNFSITTGRGYEFVTINDTTWNPTEYTNKSDFNRLVVRYKSSDTKVRLGSLTKADRAPVWIVDEEVCSSEPKSEKSVKSADEHDVKVYKPVSRSVSAKKSLELCRKAGVSHIVRAEFDAAEYTDIVFTAYRLNKPYDVLTEQVIGGGVAQKDELGVLWFDVGNFKKPWQHEEEVILIIEATKEGKGYFSVSNFKLDRGIDIQELGMISLEPIPEPNVKTTLSSVHWKEVKNANVVGYSLYRDDERINEEVITEKEYLVQGEIILKPVIQGGYETVYSSNTMASVQRDLLPLQFSFGSIFPNPFTKSTEIKYALPCQVKVNIVIFDIIGRKVRTLVSERQEPGYYSRIWDGVDYKGRRVSSGIYFIRFVAGEFISQDKILLVK